MNHAISYTWWWDGYGWMSFAHMFFSSRCIIQFCLSFPFFAQYKKKQTRIFIRHSPFTGYFFLFFLLDFFQAWVNIFVRVIPFEYITYLLPYFVLSFRFLLILLWSIDLCMHIYKIVVFLFSSNKHLIKQYNSKNKKKSITA